MRKVHIQSESVRRNIELFQQIVAHFREGTKAEKNKTYQVFINRINGLMRFSGGQGLNPAEWKEAAIQINLDDHIIEAFDQAGKGEQFNQGDLSSLARRILAETMRTLQDIVPEIHDLQELTRLEFEPSLAMAKARDIVHEAWHEASRLEAEKILSAHSPGTYIFRKDEYASVLEHELVGVFRSPVKCLTLTYLDPKNNVRDKTIVRYRDQWAFYDDDPTLSGRTFTTMEELLSSMQRELTKPLYAN